MSAVEAVASCCLRRHGAAKRRREVCPVELPSGVSWGCVQGWVEFPQQRYLLVSDHRPYPGLMSSLAGEVYTKPAFLVMGVLIAWRCRFSSTATLQPLKVP